MYCLTPKMSEPPEGNMFCPWVFFLFHFHHILIQNPINYNDIIEKRKTLI